MNLSKKAKIKFGMFISLCCVCAATIPMVTYAWFKQYLDVSGTRIEISSGESVAYIEVELYTYKNGKLGDRLAFHSSKGGENIGATIVDTSASGNTGTVKINFNKIQDMNVDLTTSQGDDGNPDFFDPDGLPELFVEFRFIKDLFTSYIKSSVKVITNSGTNNYIDSAGTAGSTAIANPFIFRDDVIKNNKTDVIGFAAKNIKANNIAWTDTTNTKVDFINSGDDKIMNQVRGTEYMRVPAANTVQKLFILQQAENGLDEPQLLVDAFDKKRPDNSGEVAFSKALLFDLCLDPLILINTIRQTNKGKQSRLMQFNLALEFTFELSNDPFKPSNP